uniref:Copper transport protein n=1 Tax=Acrobeloides nanus TaxID=290746 RepID=A0A914DY78_9BILA
MPTKSMTLYATIETFSTPTTMRYMDKRYHLIQTSLFGLQIIVKYLLMFVFVTSSFWLGLAVTLGTAFGYYLFDSNIFKKEISFDIN